MFLQGKGLWFGYPGCAVLQGVSFGWHAGLALVHGPESCGKTTLLRLLAGELAAEAGEIALRGAPGGAGQAGYRAQVFWQDPRSTALDGLSAREWLGSLPVQYPAWDTAALAAHVQGFALDPHLDKPFYALSTGSRRKVLMAGALASTAALTLLDEPLAALDKPSIHYLVDALGQAARGSQRLVVVAHHEALPGLAAAQGIDLAA